VEKIKNPVLIVKNLLWSAFESRISDIHIETKETGILIQFRQGGMLKIWNRFPLEMNESLINRIKILCRLETSTGSCINESRILEMEGLPPAHFRVSFLPSYFGEKIAIRVLGRDLKFKNSSEIGLTNPILNHIDKIFKKNCGLFLVTGPTGSGKTTTLHALLNENIPPTKNLITLEDPIEYIQKHATQIPVTKQVSFQAGLKACLRQDPDVLFIGEIRDSQTAQLAIEYALSGHLVLSTLHSDNCFQTILRLLDFKISPLLIFEALQGILSQKLNYLHQQASAQFEFFNTTPLKNKNINPEMIYNEMKKYLGTMYFPFSETLF